jgi:hypothetical protein
MTHEWSPDRLRLFVSHTSAHRQAVSQLKHSLQESGVDAFIAHADIEPTVEWLAELESALGTCHALAAYLTSDFHGSHWTDQEVGHALMRQILIVPVTFDMEPYGFLAKFQALRAEKLSSTELAEGIVNLLAHHPTTRPTMATALVATFQASSSFYAARRNVTLLDKVSAWTPELLEEIENAIARNRNLAGAYGVPECVRDLINKYRQ